MGAPNRFAALAAPGVRSLSPYLPGKPTATLERELGIKGSIKLASNENPLGPGPRCAGRTGVRPSITSATTPTAAGMGCAPGSRTDSASTSTR